MTDNQREDAWTGAGNTEDRFPFPSPAERALDEITAILNRMLALAKQAAGGGDVDRPALQAELDRLKEELDRAADRVSIRKDPPHIV